MSRMERHNLYLRPGTWSSLVKIAGEESARTGKPVSTAKIVRRILEEGLSRRALPTKIDVRTIPMTAEEVEANTRDGVLILTPRFREARDEQG